MITRWPDSIVFDLDGTILHSLPGIEYSIREAFAVTQRPFRDGELRELIGPPISTILAMVGNIEKDECTLDLLEDAFRTSYDNGGWRKTELFPDTKVALEALRREGYRLFVVTNKPKKISVRIMEYLGDQRSIRSDSNSRFAFTNVQRQRGDAAHACREASDRLAGLADGGGRDGRRQGIRCCWNAVRIYRTRVRQN